MPHKTGTVYIDDDTSESPQEVEGSLSENSSTSELDDLEKKASTFIFEAQSKRPFLSRNRDRISIYLNRVTITKGDKYTGAEYPMSIENITGARIYKRFFYASLEIDTFGVVKPDFLDYLNPDEARLARRYILALIECKKTGIDLSGLPLDQLREKLKKIGMVRHSLEGKENSEI